MTITFYHQIQVGQAQPRIVVNPMQQEVPHRPSNQGKPHPFG